MRKMVLEDVTKVFYCYHPGCNFRTESETEALKHKIANKNHQMIRVLLEVGEV